MVTPFETTAPRALISNCFANSEPQLKQPEAGITGLREKAVLMAGGEIDLHRRRHLHQCTVRAGHRETATAGEFRPLVSLSL